jgi:hypothetical protein
MPYANTYFEAGTHNRECDICGWVFKFNQLKENWEGLWVCEKDWEPKPHRFLPKNKVRTPRPVKSINKSSQTASRLV